MRLSNFDLQILADVIAERVYARIEKRATVRNEAALRQTKAIPMQMAILLDEGQLLRRLLAESSK